MLARAWFDHHDFSTLPPSGDGSYDPPKTASTLFIERYCVKRSLNDQIIHYQEAVLWLILCGQTKRAGETDIARSPTNL